MTTYVRAPEAARLLGVTTPTLYSYVSRRRVTRTLGADGRTSLFDVAELTELRERTRRPPPPPPTIDVRIATSVTQIDESGLRYRSIPVADLVDADYECVAELLWTGDLPTKRPAWPRPTGGAQPARPAHSGDSASTSTAASTAPNAVMQMAAIAAGLDPNHDAITTARHLLMLAPTLTGTGRSPGRGNRRLADHLAAGWVDRSSGPLTDVVNAALVLLADHELATSTLAVRVAASVRSSPAAAIVAGLATIDGDLHGSASRYAHALFHDVATHGAEQVLDHYRAEHRRVPGFGHSIYRERDPRFELLLERVRRLPASRRRLDVVDELVAIAGWYVPRPPNIDLALGALTYVAGLPPDLPLFAIARIAGWAAHYLEEIDERPVRYRGLAHAP